MRSQKQILFFYLFNPFASLTALLISISFPRSEFNLSEKEKEEEEEKMCSEKENRKKRIEEKEFCTLEENYSFAL